MTKKITLKLKDALFKHVKSIWKEMRGNSDIYENLLFRGKVD